MAKGLIFFILLFASINLVAGERFAVPYRPDIDLTKNAVYFNCNDANFTVDISRPLIPFNKAKMTLKTDIDTLTEVKATLNMKMDMGNFNYTFRNINGLYETEFILPKCLWGDKRWFVKLSIIYNHSQCEKVLLFDMVR